MRQKGNKMIRWKMAEELGYKPITTFWQDFSIANEVSCALSLPVKIANDANVAALGEARFGCGKGYRHSVMITLGTGVGSGIVLDGKRLDAETADFKIFARFKLIHFAGEFVFGAQKTGGQCRCAERNIHLVAEDPASFDMVIVFMGN